MTATEISSLIDRYLDAYNRKDVDNMLATLHPLVTFRNISAGTVDASTSGIAEFRALAMKSVALFSQRNQRIASLEIQGPVAVASIAFRGVVADDLPNGLKKGQVLSLSGRSEFEFQDGLISSITDVS